MLELLFIGWIIYAAVNIAYIAITHKPVSPKPVTPEMEAAWLAAKNKTVADRLAERAALRCGKEI